MIEQFSKQRVATESVIRKTDDGVEFQDIQIVSTRVYVTDDPELIPDRGDDQRSPLRRVKRTVERSSPTEFSEVEVWQKPNPFTTAP